MSDYRDWHSDSDWVIADDVATKSAMEVLSSDDRHRWLRMGSMTSFEQPDRIEALRILVGGDKSLPIPFSLTRLTGLKYLSMPLDYASKLNPELLPSSIETLCFDEGETTKVRRIVPTESVFPSVRRLKSVSGTLIFAHASFPSLASVSLRLDAKHNMVSELLKLPRLAEVNVGPIHTSEELCALAPLDPEHLGIFTGRLERLDALAHFPNLERLWLHSLSKLTDISMVSGMHSLKTVEILYCPRLEDLRPLLHARFLENLSIVQCRGIELAPVVDDLVNAGLRTLNISGDKYLYQCDGRWITNAR